MNTAHNLEVIKGANKGRDPLAARFEEFIKAELLDLDDNDYLDMIELEAASPDEVTLGYLTTFEKQCFALAQLVEQSIEEVLLEHEASAVEAMAKHIRDHKVPMVIAMQQQLQHLPEAARIDLNKRAITHTALITAYDWSVRSRFNRWSGFLVVRRDFVVHTYG